MSAAPARNEPRSAFVSERAIWRSGYEAGLKDGTRRFFQSAVVENIAVELVLMRSVAESLGKQADYWRAKFLDAVHVIGSPRR